MLIFRQLGDSVRRLKHDQFITCVEAVTASLFQFCEVSGELFTHF